jgi:hypothetical protein
MSPAFGFVFAGLLIAFVLQLISSILRLKDDKKTDQQKQQ